VSSARFDNIPQDGSTEYMTANGVVDAADTPLEAIGGLYDPGPSFSEDERPAARLSLMPAWLQTFAATTGEPEDGPAVTPPAAIEMPAAPVLTAPVPEEPVTELPSWLAEERPAPSGDSAADAAQLAAAAATLISEDDLPEWLRAISPADDQDALVTFGTEAAAAHAARPVLAVPSIGRAWTTAHDRPALSEGASMFALMARESVATALPAPASDYSSSSEDLSDAGPHEPDPLAPPAESLATPVRAAGAAPAAEQPRRMWMVYAVALLLVILVLVAVRLFM
jgi:hypothetical protein